MPHTAIYGIDQFLPWTHCQMKFLALWWFKTIYSTLIVFARMFERADKFMAFIQYHNVAFTIFSVMTAAYILVCHSLTNMVTPSFFRIFFKWYTHRHFLKILQKSCRYICPKLAQVWPICPRQPNMVLAIFTCKTTMRAKKLSKSFLAQW